MNVGLEAINYKNTCGSVPRISYSRSADSDVLYNLMEIQRHSYYSFIGFDEENGEYISEKSGLSAAFRSIFPISDNNDRALLECISCYVGSPKYDEQESMRRETTYSLPVRTKLRITVWEIDPDTKHREIKSIKEQEVYICDLPMMTQNATFIVNGKARVAVSQLHRAPGGFWDNDRGKTYSSGKLLYFARIIPYRGSWLDIEFDARDILYFRIDKRRKMLVTTLLKALGLTSRDIINYFYKKVSCRRLGDSWAIDYHPDFFANTTLPFDLINAETKEVVYQSNKRVTTRVAGKLRDEGLTSYLIPLERLEGYYLARDVIDPKEKSILAHAGSLITKEALTKINLLNIPSIEVVVVNINYSPYIINTLALDKTESKDEALCDIYRVLRPGEVPTPETAAYVMNNTFFEKEYYDLSPVGRVKLNASLGLDYDEHLTVLTKEDILRTIQKLVNIHDDLGSIDDIDHLGSRRIRSVGEFIENQFRIGLVKMAKVTLDQMSILDLDQVMPSDLINSKPLSGALRDFFVSSQLSQFMDQTNPLSEITHKRRLSALGPGGLTRERAGYEVRDVHPSHYGRICPIETPEGQNIGLISSLASYAKVNKYGFIEAPYFKVEDGVVTDKIHYLSAFEEDKYYIAPANVPRDQNNKFIDSSLYSRKSGDFVMAAASEVNYVDISPRQVVSIASSLIPFLENDDANRALMGSNMQRQAVPLLSPKSPLVGTGMESVVARGSGSLLTAKRGGVVDRVDSAKISVRVFSSDGKFLGLDNYTLRKFQKSNHNTCINDRVAVSTGDTIKAGDILAYGPATDSGDLALGSNVLIAFMSWQGYNFEDSIVISSRVVENNIFASIHIEEFECIVRDTRLGPEGITRDIPSIPEESLRHLDEWGIVHIGAEVAAGDVLIGKVTPKGEPYLTPEEKLLRAIFGERAADVKDSSLYVPPGVQGTVTEVRVFSRRGVEKNGRAIYIEAEKIREFAQEKEYEIEVANRELQRQLSKILIGHKVMQAYNFGVNSLAKGAVITEESLELIPEVKRWGILVEDRTANIAKDELISLLNKLTKAAEASYQEKVDRLQSADDIPQGVLYIVKVFVAVKYDLQAGDKMSGRHGNKGVISKIVPEYDMPYLEDGTPIDVVLNSLGVPSRMNVGQILETHLGWACMRLARKVGKMLIDETEEGVEVLRGFLTKIYSHGFNAEVLERIKGYNHLELRIFAQKVAEKGVHIASPVFEGPKDGEISALLELADLDSSGQVYLFDGRTGERFDRKVTVGYNYMLKLHHLVDDKIHARSVGPYSLVTQQPLGGKAHFGGQRFGEMESWALQAYGAAYVLQEMLTVKSDDVKGRIRVYEAIIRGDNNFEYGIPESFTVTMKELQSLCLDIELLQEDDK